VNFFAWRDLCPPDWPAEARSLRHDSVGARCQCHAGISSAVSGEQGCAANFTARPRRYNRTLRCNGGLHTAAETSEPL